MECHSPSARINAQIDRRIPRDEAATHIVQRYHYDGIAMYATWLASDPESRTGPGDHAALQVSDIAEPGALQCLRRCHAPMPAPANGDNREVAVQFRCSSGEDAERNMDSAVNVAGKPLVALTDINDLDVALTQQVSNLGGAPLWNLSATSQPLPEHHRRKSPFRQLIRRRLTLTLDGHPTDAPGSAPFRSRRPCGAGSPVGA